MHQKELVEKSNAFNYDFFKPAWWLSGSHMQTIGGWFLRQFTTITYSRKKLELSDGDFLNLDIYRLITNLGGKKLSGL